MKDKLNRFVENLQGQFVEVSYKEAIYQCMDLVYCWVYCLDYPKETIQNQYAYQVFKNPKPITKQYFDIIPNTETFIPQDGDIGVYNKTASNIAGHIVICLGGGTTSTFKRFEQNSPVGTNAHIGSGNYNNFLGVLRPKVFNEPKPLEINDKTMIPMGGIYGNLELQALKSILGDKERDLVDVQAKLKACELKPPVIDQDTINQAVKSAVLERDKYWQSEVEIANKQIEELKQKTADSLTIGELFELLVKKITNRG